MAHVRRSVRAHEARSRGTVRPPPAHIEDVRRTGEHEIQEVEDTLASDPSPADATAADRAFVSGCTFEPHDFIDDRFLVEGLPRARGHLARAPGLDLRVGVPIELHAVAPEDQPHAAIVGRFVREARLSALVRQAHVARVLAVGWLEPGAPYAAVERGGGPRLDELLALRGALPVDDAIAWAAQAADGLAAYHEVGLVHGALVPSAFRVEAAGCVPCVRLVDVVAPGLAISEPWALPPAVLAHIAPEVLMGLAPPDARSDVWSLGALAYLMLAGTPAFLAQTPAATLVAAAARPMPALRARRSDVPASLEAVIARCLAKDPAERYANVAVAREALAACARAEAPAAAPAAVPATGAAAEGATTVSSVQSPGPSRARHGPMSRRSAATVGIAVGLAFSVGFALARVELRPSPSPSAAALPSAPAQPSRAEPSGAIARDAPRAPKLSVAAARAPAVGRAPAPKASRLAASRSKPGGDSPQALAPAPAPAAGDPLEPPKPAPAPVGSNLFDSVR